MTNHDIFIRQLTTALGSNPHLREALADTLFALISEEQQHSEVPVASYLDLLEQLARQRKDARSTGRTQLDLALQQLCRQLTQELHRSALALHIAIKTKQPPDAEHLRRVGINMNGFPAGIAPAHNLKLLSETYFQVTRDLHTLGHYAEDTVPELTHALQQEQCAIAPLIRDTAWEALSTGLFPDRDLLNFSDACTQAFARQRIIAENALIAILKGKSLDTITTLAPQIRDWLSQFGRPHWPLLHTLVPASLPVILHALVRMPEPIGLEALAAMPLRGRDAALLLTLLTLRFGDVCPFSPEDWSSWLTHRLNADTQHAEAVAFWQAHPYALPPLLCEWFQSFPSKQKVALDIPEPLLLKIRTGSGITSISDLLNRRRTTMTPHEIQVLENLSGISPVSHPSPAAHTIEGILETALDAMKEGNLVEATLVTAIDKGSAGLKQQLTVTLDDDERDDTPASSTTIAFSRPIPPSRPPEQIATEPEINLWHERILPFVTQNWAPLSGGSMILTGLLLLEFYIWDKAAWIRYGVSPVIIAFIAVVLTLTGRRLRRDTEKVETSAAIIQGLAVFLTPLSLLFVTLFFVDSNLALTNRIIWGSVLSGILLIAWSSVFILSMSSIDRRMTRLYSVTLLILNGLFLLLPVIQLMAPGSAWLTPGTKAVLATGFYGGFAVLGWSLHTALTRMLADSDDFGDALTFYSVTCIGTFGLVWGLIHAYLRVLPQPFTYGPLLICGSALMMTVEFLLFRHFKQTGRITTLSYSAYFLIGLGVLLSIGQEYVRVIALLLAGGVWMYQAVSLGRMPVPPGLKSSSSRRHANMALTLGLLGLSLIAMIRQFPPTAFPFLALGIAVTLHLLPRQSAIFRDNPFVSALSPIYLALAFAIAVIWQWARSIEPLGYGIAFLLFAVFALYLGAATAKLLHVHAGMGYCVAALPYLGMMDMELFTLEGNTLVFGLAVVGIAWTALSSLAPVPPFRESRSTVLWNIGILALCLMCLRLFLQETLDFSSAGVLLQFQILSAPLIIGALMLLTGYFTNSYPAVYLALGIFLFIFPEIKDQLLTYPGVQTLVSTGLGSSLTAIGLILLVYVLKFWRALRQQKTHDRIWRQKAFPFQARNGYLLFAHPLMVAALFLLSRHLLYRYPKAAFFPPYEFSVLAWLAVMLAGSGYLAFSLWYRQPWFSYIGLLAILVGTVHSGIFELTPFFAPETLPILVLLVFFYGEVLCSTSSWIFPERTSFLLTPFRHVKFFFLWWIGLTSFLLYMLFQSEGAGLWQWLPLMLYFCGIAGWLTWHTNRLWRAWFILIPGYLLVWQVVLIAVFDWTDRRHLFPTTGTSFFLATAGTVLAVVVAFFGVEWRLSSTRFRLLSPLLWLSLIFLGIWSSVAVSNFYAHPLRFMSLPFLSWNFVIWAIVALVLGRYLQIALLWLWAVFLLHFLMLPIPADYGAIYLSLSPLALSGIAGIIALLAVVTRRFSWLYRQRYPWPWSRSEANTPATVFALVSQLCVIAVFGQALLHPAHHTTWPTVLGLFLSVLPALLVAPMFGMSRRRLAIPPYFGAWIGLAIAGQANLSQQLWNPDLPRPLLVACGLFGAIMSLVPVEFMRPSSDVASTILKYAGMAAVLAGPVLAYLPIRNIHLLNWQWLVVSSILFFGSALFFKHFSNL